MVGYLLIEILISNSLLRPRRPLASGVARDLAPPRAALRPARLDQLLEALEVALHPPVGRAELVAELLLDALGHPVELHHHARAVLVELVEGHHAGVVLAVRVAPGDALLGRLLSDLRVPL